MQIVSRQEALEKRLRFYFTGNPCKHGHISVRYTNNNTCKDCKKIHNSTESAKEYQAEYRAENKQELTMYFKARYEEKKTEILAQHKDYYMLHKKEMRAKQKIYQQLRYELNPGPDNEKLARRRAAQKGAAVEWADKVKMREIYSRRAKLKNETGTNYHVDHIVPLQHKLVCGLHNEFNLQVLTEPENCAKGNRHWPDMPDDIEEALNYFYG